jgi:cytochrome b
MSEGVRARLWDGPTRVVHWLLVVLIGFSWWASEDHLDWHMWSGLTILALVAFRIFWGFAGGRAARFASFVCGPVTTLKYAATLPRRAASNIPGHNPLGGWSILAILATLATQIGTGLLSSDIDGLDSGPLSHLVDFDTSRVLADIHETAFKVLQVLVVLHVAAVLFYLVYKRTNLITPMITGRKVFPEDPGLAGAPFWRLLLGMAIAGALAWWVSKGAPLPT